MATTPHTPTPWTWCTWMGPRGSPATAPPMALAGSPATGTPTTPWPASAPEFAQRVGYDVVSFRRGRIQELRLDRGRLADWLAGNPLRSSEDYLSLEAELSRLRQAEPLIPDDSVDIVVSNCVLNLVRP